MLGLIKASSHSLQGVDSGAESAILQPFAILYQWFGTVQWLEGPGFTEKGPFCVKFVHVYGYSVGFLPQCKAMHLVRLGKLMIVNGP